MSPGSRELGDHGTQAIDIGERRSPRAICRPPPAGTYYVGPSVSMRRGCGSRSPLRGSWPLISTFPSSVKCRCRTHFSGGMSGCIRLVEIANGIRRTWSACARTGIGHVAAAPPIRVMRSRQRTPALPATANKVADLNIPRRVPELLNTFAM
jgi:hypothetical protein